MDNSVVIGPEAVLGVVTVLVSGLTGWLFSLHGRISRHEAGCEQRQALINERHLVLQEELRDIKQEAKSTNRKLDRLLAVKTGEDLT